MLGRGHGCGQHGNHQLLAADAAAAELGPGGGTYLHISTEYLDISIEYLHIYTEYLLDIYAYLLNIYLISTHIY